MSDKNQKFSRLEVQHHPHILIVFKNYEIRFFEYDGVEDALKDAQKFISAGAEKAIVACKVRTMKQV